jgi:sulfite reductase alpha subunit-like flavoprotein
MNGINFADSLLAGRAAQTIRSYGASNVHYPAQPGLLANQAVQSFEVVDARDIRTQHDASTRAVEVTLRPVHGVGDWLKSGMQIGIMPKNHMDVVTCILGCLRDVPEGKTEVFRPASAASAKGTQRLSAADALSQLVDLARPTEELLLWIAQQELGPDHPCKGYQQQLVYLIRQGWLEELTKQYSVADMLTIFKGVVSFQALLANQPPLANRKYTLSDVNLEQGTIRIMVADVRHEVPHRQWLGEPEALLPHVHMPDGRATRQYRGAATRYILDSVDGKGDDEWIGFMDARKRKLPYPAVDEARPALLVHTGVGLAPHMSYLREVARANGKSKATMIAGGKKPEDALMQEELNAYIKQGVLADYHYIPSRGGAADAPRYVQDALRSKADDVWRMLEQEGGTIYVCGYERMLDGVRDSLRAIAKAHGADPEAWLAKLVENKQLQFSASEEGRFYHDWHEAHSESRQASLKQLAHLEKPGLISSTTREAGQDKQEIVLAA